MSRSTDREYDTVSTDTASTDTVSNTADNSLIADKLASTLDEVAGSRAQRILHHAPRLLWTRLLYSTSRLYQQGLRCQAKTFWGGRMNVVLPEPMSHSIYRYGYCEPDMSLMLARTLKPGMVFFDIGAHFGYASMLASALVGPSGRVYAFEPSPSTYQVLESNARLAGNITTINRAVYSQRAILEFNDLGVNRSSLNSPFTPRVEEQAAHELDGTKYQVETISVDEFVQSSGAVPQVVKIDAESAEQHILLGMAALLDQARPAIVMEVGDFNVDGAARSSDLVHFMQEHGYVAYQAVGARLVRQQAQQHYEAGNRLFVHRDNASGLQ